MSIVVKAPPPRCTACGRVASTQADELACVACGATLPPRASDTIVRMGKDDALAATLPAIVPPKMPEISGTALLAAKRMTELRVTFDAAELEAIRTAGGVVIRLVAQEVVDGVPLPAHVGVTIDASEDAIEPRTWCDLAPGLALTLQRPLPPDARHVFVTLTFGDAICKRRVEVA